MIHLDIYESRDEWLSNRSDRIGGSDAACILGKNPWRSNVQLYREKTGIVPHESMDTENNRAINYGIAAEPLLRELFALDHPEAHICYAENNMWTNDEYPFAHASLDGWIENEEDESVCGILEIKTATIQSRKQ